MTLPERAAALAVHLANSRIITPTLTDDAATLTVVLDVGAILVALEETRREALEEMRGALQMVNGFADHWHEKYRALLDPPDSKRPGTTEDVGPRQGGTEW